MIYDAKAYKMFKLMPIITKHTIVQDVDAVQMVVVVRALVVWASAVNPNVHQWLRQVESV